MSVRWQQTSLILSDEKYGADISCILNSKLKYWYSTYFKYIYFKLFLLLHTSSFITSTCSHRRSWSEVEGTTVNPTEDSSESVMEWTSEAPELEEISHEELSHMLLPDSLSQLEEFGRYKRPRKTHHAHSRPRLFSDLWVRIGDRWGQNTCQKPHFHNREFKADFN